jgi:hypothetical protein
MTNQDRPTIRIDGDLLKLVDQLTELLIAADLRIYRRDNGNLIYVYSQEFHGKIYPQPDRLQSVRMAMFMARVARFIKRDPRRRDEWMPIDPPGALARLVIKHGSFPPYDEAEDAARFARRERVPGMQSYNLGAVRGERVA